VRVESRDSYSDQVVSDGLSGMDNHVVYMGKNDDRNLKKKKPVGEGGSQQIKKTGSGSKRVTIEGHGKVRVKRKRPGSRKLNLKY